MSCVRGGTGRLVGAAGSGLAVRLSDLIALSYSLNNYCASLAMCAGRVQFSW